MAVRRAPSARIAFHGRRTRRWAGIGAVVLALPLPAGDGTKRLTLEQTMGPGAVSFSASPPSVAFARDGIHLEMRKEGRTIWVEPRSRTEVEPPADVAAEGGRAGSSARARALPEPAVTTAELAAALGRLPGFDEAAAKRVAGGRRVDSADGAAVLLDSEGDLYFFHAGREQAQRLTFTAEPEENALLSADGRLVSFVRGNDLHLVGTDGGRERAVTRDGGPEKLNGKLDWVYQEEVYGRGNFQACWWSPTSRHVAFLSLDQTGIPRHPIVDHLPDRAALEEMRYPKAGDPNPTVALGVARARDGRVVWVDLSKYEGVEPLVVRVGWTPSDWSPDGSKICFQVQDREQTWLDLNLADPDRGSVTTLLRETSPAWVNVLAEPHWLEDGSFLWLSERSGYKHIYRCSADGRLLAQLTSGDWEVRDVTAVDPKAGRVWFTAGRDSAIASNLYRVALDGSGLVRLTQGGGTHSVSWNGDRSLFLDRVSSIAFPPEVRLCNGEDGAILEVLGRAEVKAIAEYGYCAPELIEIPARDGFRMDATIVRPARLEPGSACPIWLPTYSGPDAPSVSDRWSGDPWTQFLAQQGYAVLQVNNRTSSRRGFAHVSKCWQQFGVQELADLEDAIAWVGASFPWADASRVGIAGWSYGGFMAAFALTHSKAFRLGVAGAGVYDWRLYDTIYTERYMRTPRNNPDGYRRTSCIEAAKDLSGHLVLAHGTLDDNVHFQNTLQFAMALQKAGREFEMMAYPGSRHGLGSMEQNWHFRKLTWKAIRERL